MGLETSTKTLFESSLYEITSTSETGFKDRIVRLILGIRSVYRLGSSDAGVELVQLVLSVHVVREDGLVGVDVDRGSVCLSVGCSGDRGRTDAVCFGHRHALVPYCSCLRRRLGPAASEAAVEEADQSTHSFSREGVLCEKVCRVHLAGDLAEVDAPCPDRLLYPQRVRVKMPQLPKPLAGADADRCRGVSPDPHWQADAEVLKKTLTSKTDTGSANHTIKLGFATAE